MKDLQPILIEKPELKEPFSYTTIYELFQEQLNGVEVEWTEEQLVCKNYKMILEYYSKFNKIIPHSTRCELMLKNVGSVKDAKGLASTKFKVGKQYYNSEVVKILQNVYNELNIKRKAKAKDLMELFVNVKQGAIRGERYMEIIKK